MTETGAQVVGHIARPDHYAPAASDVADLRRRMEGERADALVMTEKDAVKWPDLSGVEAYALRVEMQVEDEAGFLGAVTIRLFGGSGR